MLLKGTQTIINRIRTVLCTTGCVVVGELAADLALGAFVFVSFGTLPVLRNAAATCALARLEDIINVVQTYKIRVGVILSTPKIGRASCRERV